MTNPMLDLGCIPYLATVVATPRFDYGKHWSMNPKLRRAAAKAVFAKVCETHMPADDVASLRRLLNRLDSDAYSSTTFECAHATWTFLLS